MFNKPHILSDKTKTSSLILSRVKKNLKSYPIKKANLFIVIGGDGFMLKVLKRFHKFNKPFYGINSGSYGFLMNKFSTKNLLKKIKIYPVSIKPLTMTVIKKNNQIKKSIAINEVSILRQSRQTAKLFIKSSNKIIIKKLISDGVLVSTPAGSTAYNLSVFGPILNLDSKKLAITPISPFRPRRWKGTIINEKSNIVIKNLDCSKRPINAVADNVEFKNAKVIKIMINKKIKFTLLYNKNSSIEKKIKLEQLRKELN
tara:strand:- start:779 stop:1549 length:771 start_codon:yes stop_codon:yes gene_type:complete